MHHLRHSNILNSGILANFLLERFNWNWILCLLFRHFRCSRCCKLQILLCKLRCSGDTEEPPGAKVCIWTIWDDEAQVRSQESEYPDFVYNSPSAVKPAILCRRLLLYIISLDGKLDVMNIKTMELPMETTTLKQAGIMGISDVELRHLNKGKLSFSFSP